MMLRHIEDDGDLSILVTGEGAMLVVCPKDIVGSAKSSREEMMDDPNLNDIIRPRMQIESSEVTGIHLRSADDVHTNTYIPGVNDNFELVNEGVVVALSTGLRILYPWAQVARLDLSSAVSAD